MPHAGVDECSCYAHIMHGSPSNHTVDPGLPQAGAAGLFSIELARAACDTIKPAPPGTMEECCKAPNLFLLEYNDGFRGAIGRSCNLEHRVLHHFDAPSSTHSRRSIARRGRADAEWLRQHTGLRWAPPRRGNAGPHSSKRHVIFRKPALQLHMPWQMQTFHN